MQNYVLHRQCISALSCTQEGFHLFSSKCKVQSRLLYIHTVMVHTHNILQRKLSQMILKPILFSSLLSPLCFSSCCLQAGQDGRPLFLSTAGHDCMSYSTPCCILCFENLAIIAHCDPKPCHHVSDRMWHWWFCRARREGSAEPKLPQLHSRRQ